MCQTNLPSFILAQLGYDSLPHKLRALDTDSTAGVQAPMLAHWRRTRLYTQPFGHHTVWLVSNMNTYIWDSLVKYIYSGNHKLNSTSAQALLACKDSPYAEN